LLGPTVEYSQYLEIVPPDGVSQLRITRADLVLYRLTTPPDAVQVEIRRSKQDGSYEPEATSIGSPATVAGGLLTVSPSWHIANFSDVTITDPARTDYCLVVSISGTTSAFVEYYYSKDAPANNTFLKWTDDGGASWDPRANQKDQYDLRFYLYGSYLTTGTQEVTVERYFVTSMRTSVRLGPDSTSRVETTVQILNQPEVATP
jgi:hypothetical protein